MTRISRFFVFGPILAVIFFYISLILRVQYDWGYLHDPNHAEFDLTCFCITFLAVLPLYSVAEKVDLEGEKLLGVLPGVLPGFFLFKAAIMSWTMIFAGILNSKFSIFHAEHVSHMVPTLIGTLVALGMIYGPLIAFGILKAVVSLYKFFASSIATSARA